MRQLWEKESETETQSKSEKQNEQEKGTVSEKTEDRDKQNKHLWLTSTNQAHQPFKLYLPWHLSHQSQYRHERKQKTSRGEPGLFQHFKKCQ